MAITHFCAATNRIDKIKNQKTENVNLNEVNKFAKLASTWWDKDGELKSLHDINPLRFEYIQAQVDLSNKTILDIGCGGGILTESLATIKGTDVTGIDLAEDSLIVAREHAKKNNLSIDYQTISAEEIAEQKPGVFDVVTCMELLEHVPDPSAIVKACAQLVKPGGFVFFSTINRNPKAFLHAIVAAEYLLGLLPKGTHQYGEFIRPAELIQWGRQADLQIISLAGMSYNLFKKRYRLTDDVSVNYLACLQK